MTQANSALSRANSVLRAHHLPGRRVRERSVRGCSS